MPTASQAIVRVLRRSAVAAALTLALAVMVVLLASAAAFATPTMGATETFWVHDYGTGKDVQTQATAQFVGDRAAVYVATGVPIPANTVNTLGAKFDSIIYPTLTAAFGTPPDPGIDGDPHVTILIYDFHERSMDGCFRPADIDVDVNDPSNRREMFYLNSTRVLEEPWNAPSLAAHEFTHLVIRFQDTMLDTLHGKVPESDWLQEGLCGYGEYLCGYTDRVDGYLLSFENKPNTSLTRWGNGERQNYGASYSFIRYLAGREGSEFIRRLVQEPLDGAVGINTVLRAMGRDWESFTDLFDDWIVAGFLDEKLPQVWQWVFQNIDVSMVPIALTGAMPSLGNGEVADHAALYYDFPASDRAATFQAVVDGADRAPLQAALVSWDSAQVLAPDVRRFSLDNAATGDTIDGPAGYDHHTLVVWSRGSLGTDSSYGFTYSGAADPPGGIQFLDMGGSDDYYPDAALLLQKGVISGKEIPVGSGLWFFKGKDNVTRAQFAKMIMLATGKHTAEIDNPNRPTFSDVPLMLYGTAAAYDFIEEAAALGIVNGFPGGTFKPSAQITRGQLVAMIVRGARAAGKLLTPYAGSEKVFADVPISHIFYRDIMTAYEAGIFTGSPKDGKLYFNPSNPAQRNHVAKMTANLIRCMEAYVAPGS
jgi:hypothetical protein